MTKDFPYKNLESTELWNVVNTAIGDLVSNNDIEEKTDRKYIIGYLCKALFESRIIFTDTEK